MLIDSNIIIYAVLPQHGHLRSFIATHAPAVSAISKLEVLGFAGLTPHDKLHFEAFFAATTVFSISDAVVNQAVTLRQFRKMSLGDALVAATALVHQRTLVTRNEKDFVGIAGLVVLNPFHP